jgi:hypothetical protein
LGIALKPNVLKCKIVKNELTLEVLEMIVTQGILPSNSIGTLPIFMDKLGVF